MTSKVSAVFIAAVVTAVVLTACGKGAAKTNSRVQNTSGSSVISSQSASGGSSAPSQSAASSYPNPDNDPLYAQAYGFYAAKQYDNSVAVCDQALAKDPNCFWAYNIKGTAIYYANGNSVADSCLSLINKSLSIDPEYSYGYFNKALIYKGLKQNDDSIACFNKALQYDPKSAWSYYGISTIYADINQVDLSIEYLKKAIDLDSACKTEAKTEYHYDRMRDNAQFKALVDS
jgi:tetratricopeptide (TPR) repeat protein